MFSSSALIDGALTVLASCLIGHRKFRSIGFLLLAYTVSALFGDYNFAMETRDRAFGTAFAAIFTLPPTLDFVVDFSGRVTLLGAIWTFLGQIKSMFT